MTPDPFFVSKKGIELQRQRPAVPGSTTNSLPISSHLFTDDARAVMRLANKEAFRLNHECITAEHILLGLLKEGSGVTPSMLARIERDFDKVRSKLMEKMDIGTTEDIPLVKLPYTVEHNAVIEHAYEEAQNCDSRLVEPAHLLLGLVRSSADTTAGKVLQALGIDADDIKKDIAKID